MLNCLTYIAFVYWAVATVHTILPIDVAVCGADPNRGGLGALLQHTFGGNVDLDVKTWEGFPCNATLLTKFGFIIRRPKSTVIHIMTNGGQDEPYVPILFCVPLIFLTICFLRDVLGLRVMSDTASRTFLKLGIAVGCRTMILLQSAFYPDKESLYYKRYSKVELFIIAWTAFIIEIPVWNEVLVSGGTLVIILLMCTLFPGEMLPEVQPWVVALHSIAATVFGIWHAAYRDRLRLRQEAARATRAAAAAAAAAAAPAATPDDDDLKLEKQRLRQQQLELGLEEEPTEAVPGAASAGGTSQTQQDASALPQTAAALPTTTCEPTELHAGDPCKPHATAAGVTHLASSIPASLSVIHRINATRRRSYVSAARPCRMSIKIRHAHLSDLPPDLLSVINGEMLAGSGWQAVSACAREGCLELVLDLRPVVPTPPQARREAAPAGRRGRDDSAALCDQDQHQDQEVRRSSQDSADSQGRGSGDEAPGQDVGRGSGRRRSRGGSATHTRVRRGDAGDREGLAGISAAAAAAAGEDEALRALSQQVVAYLQHVGLVRPEQDAELVVQLGEGAVRVRWLPDTRAWAASDAASEVAAATPVLRAVSPRVAQWAGPGLPLRLRAEISGPTAEEVLAGGALVVRSLERQLVYSVAHVHPVGGDSTGGCDGVPEEEKGMQRGEAFGASTSTAAPAAPAGHSGPPRVLVVDLLVHGAPPSGLLQVEARSSCGLLSRALGVVVDHDPDVVAGLAAVTRAMADAESADALLVDLGSWLDAAAGAVSGKGRFSEPQPACAAGAGASAAGGSSSEASFPAASAAGQAETLAYGNLDPVVLASAAGVAAAAAPPLHGHPYLDLSYDLRDQTHSVSFPPPAASMLAAAADLLAACCACPMRSRREGEAVAALADRLLAAVLVCDRRPALQAFRELLAAVQSPPTLAGAVHQAVAAGNTGVLEVLVRWHERLGVAEEAWAARAMCGVTPLHVAAGLGDGGRMAAHILGCYPAAAAAWGGLTSDDGVTPAGLAGAGRGVRGRLVRFLASPAVRRLRGALALPPRAVQVVELVWRFRDAVRERRFAVAASKQAACTLALYAVLHTVLPLVSLVKALLLHHPAGGLAALAYHAPHALLLLALPCLAGSAHCNSIARILTFTASPSASQSTAPYDEPWGPGVQPANPPRPWGLARLLTVLRGRGNSPHSPRPAASIPSLPTANERQHHCAFTAMHVARAALKALVGLGAWPFRMPRAALAFTAHGSDILLEAVLRPLLEHVSLPQRVLLSAVDLPAMFLLYRGVSRQLEGAFPCPLGRLVLYQGVLLATTAAVCMVNRSRFVRMEMRRLAWAHATGVGEAEAAGPGGKAGVEKVQLLGMGIGAGRGAAGVVGIAGTSGGGGSMQVVGSFGGLGAAGADCVRLRKVRVPL